MGRLAMKAGRVARMVNPVGLVVGILAVAGIAATRLASGKPLEGTGADLQKLLWGDKVEQARASKVTRDLMTSDSAILGIYGQFGKDEVSELYSHYYDKNLKLEKARTLFKQEMPVNSTIDMLIIRARDEFVRLWNGSEGPEKADQLGRKLAAELAQYRQEPSWYGLTLVGAGW